MMHASEHAPYKRHKRHPISMRLRRTIELLLIVTAACSSTAFVSNPKHQRTSADLRASTTPTTSSHTKHIDRDIYTPEKVQGESFDAVVIGSGIGGLTAASLLAQAGKKVLCLEQHYVAGGACHTFQHKGYRFATGIHYVGEMGDDDTEMKGLQVSMKRLIDTVAPPGDPVVFDRMDDNYETVFIGDNRYEIVAGEEAMTQALIQRFPDEEEAIREYYKQAHRVRAKSERALLFKALPLPLARFLTRTGLYRLISGVYRKYAKLSVKDGLKELTDNKDLQALLAYNYGDYGTEPSKAPYWMQLMLATHYLEGAYYPRGGPSQIPLKVIQTIVDNNGKVLVSAPVERIVVDDKTGKVTGVELKDGNVIKSNVVVSDCGLINTATKLLPPDLINVEFALDDNNGDDRLHPGTSGINLFVGLKGDAQSMNLPKSNVWIHPSNDLSGTAQKLDAMTLDEALESDPKELGFIFVGCPSTKDSLWPQEHPDKSCMEIISFLPYRWFETFSSSFDEKTRSHGPEYENAKKRIAEKQWTRVVQVLNDRMGAKLPASLDQVDFYEIGSPLTFAHYYNSERGAFYGLDNDMKRFDPSTFFLRLRPEVPEVKGLYLTGQDVTMDSLGGAMIGGLLCARKVLGVIRPTSLLN